ncbi:hypothetical protein CBP52_11160 [Cellulomonas sp. PSBB021]|nr:hypothetical protein CBP52_11160 [Cellulomonas sp. PSBB021]
MQDAFETTGVRVSRRSDAASDLELLVGGARVPVQVKRWSVFPEHAVRTNPAFRPGATSPGVRVVVADRIGVDARRALEAAGWGWLDLRGMLHVEGQDLFIHAEVPAVRDRPRPRDPLGAPAGLEIACALLSSPAEDHAVRGLARRLGRSPSTVSELLSALRDASLVEGSTFRPAPELFWSVVDVWPGNRVGLASAPGPGMGAAYEVLGLGFEDVAATTGWALTDTLAAAAYGAPVAARADRPADFFVPTEVSLRRARSLLGVARSPAEVRCTVRVAPVPEVCRVRVDAADLSVEADALAAPVFVALDLAQDAGRGREILDDWTPPEPWTRVW